MNLSDLLDSAWQGLATSRGASPQAFAPAGTAGCVVFFALHNGVDRAHVHAARGKDLEAAWQQGTQALEAFVAARSSHPLQSLRVDVVSQVQMLTWGELKTRLSQNPPPRFREGVAFEARFDVALLAQEIAGHAILQEPGATHAQPHPVNLRACGHHRFGIDLAFPDDAAAPVWCFRTHAVLVDAEGVHPLGAEGAATGYRSRSRWSAPQLRQLIADGSDHLAARVRPDGTFDDGGVHHAAPSALAFDALRHAHAVHALVEASAFTKADAHKAAMHRALARLTTTLIRTTPLQDGTLAAGLAGPGGQARFDGNAACLLALVAYTKSTGDTTHLALMTQLALGIVQTHDASHSEGLTGFSLLRLYSLTGERRWLTAAGRLFEHFIATGDKRTDDPWLASGINELSRYRPEPVIFQFGLQHLAALLDANAVPTGPMPLIAAFDMVSRLAANPVLRPLLAGLDRHRLRLALEERAHRLADSHFWPELAMFFPDPARVRGAFFNRALGFRLDIEDVACGLRDCAACLKFLQATADDAGEGAASTLLSPTDGPVVAWGGDINLGGRQHHRTQELGWLAVLGGVPVIAQADLGIANLACVVSSWRGPHDAASDDDSSDRRHARPEMLRLLGEAGIDVIATANRHSGDDKARGHRAALLDAAGIGHTGSGPTLEAALQPVLRRAGHLNVALFSLDAAAPKLAAGEASAGNAYLPPSSPTAWTACLAPRMAAARLQAHVVLVAVHWGSDGTPANSDADRTAIGRALIDAGADAVLGTSAQGQQAVEIYRDRPIVHGAGDLLRDTMHDEGESGVFSLQLGNSGVQRVVLTPLRLGFGQTVQLEGPQAAAAASRFLQKSQALGSAFKLAATGQCFIDLQPPYRKPVSLPLLPRRGHHPDAIRAATQPQEEWLANEVPRAARLESPVPLGPLRLLGARVTPDRLTGRGSVTVETFWQLDQPTGIDWRLDICAFPFTCVDAPAWGLSTDHDPCDWTWPTSRWQPGLIYRDVHRLRPPAAPLYDVELQIDVGLVTATAQVERERLQLFVDFTVHADKPTPAPPKVFPPMPRYRVFPPEALPPDLPGEPRQTWNAAQLAAVTGGTWLVAPPPGWFVRSVSRGEALTEDLPLPALFVASDYWTLAIHERFSDNAHERNWDWSDEIVRMQPQLVGAVLRRPIAGLAPDFPVLLVDDPIQSLVELGVAARQRLQGHVIAITGSAGKTSVCHMLDHAFSASHSRFATIQNYNSRVGVLAMLACVPAQTDLVILEIAVSAINAQDFQHVKLVRPDLAVITNITASHLDDGETVEDVARRKANVFEGMHPGAWAVLCTDTEYFDYLMTRAQARSLKVLTYGTTAAADFRLEAHDPASGRIRASHAGRHFEYTLGAKGRHMAVNSLVCFAVTHALALDDSQVCAQLASFAAVPGRGQVLPFALGDKHFRVIDESYNANPLSMTAALASMADEPRGNGRKILVLGDMLELGDDTSRYHEALVEPIAQCEPALVFLLGTFMSRQRDRIAAALPPTSTVHACESLDALERTLLDAIDSGDLVLLKSSNGMRLWQIVRTLTRRQEAQRRQQPAASAPVAIAPMPLPPAAVIRRAGASADTEPAAPSWVLYDMTHDRLLTHQPASHPFAPAALSLLMTAVLVEQKLHAERLDRHAEPVPVAVGDDSSDALLAAAASQPVQRLLEAALIASSRKDALALASWHSESPAAFVSAMNRQAQAWGMTDTHFACPTGLQAAARTTAVDMLTMARHVLQGFSSVFQVAGTARLSDVPEAALLEQVANVDGLQAGALPGGGAHLIATAQRDGRRLISVVLGASDGPTCTRLSALLLQRGFETPGEGAAS